MKRIILPLLFLAAIVAVLGVGAVGVVILIRNRPVIGTNPVAPISYDEMGELQENPDKALAEMPRVLACLDKDDDDLRLQAALTLGKIGPKAVPMLREKLKDKSGSVRFYAAWSLAAMGADAAEAADALAAALADESADVRYKAAYALGRAGVPSDAIISRLADAMNDPDQVVIDSAQEALEKIGRPAVPKLYLLVKTSKRPTQERILAVLEKVGAPPQSALPTLVELVKDPESQSMRGNSIRLLGRLGKDAVPTFKDLLKISNPKDDYDLMLALNLLGSDAKELLPDLSAYLAARSFWDFEPEAAAPYKKCGVDGAKALVELFQTIQAKNANPLDSREMLILRTLGDMGADAKVAAPMLSELLKDKDRYRVQVLETLGEIGPAAREARPAVEALLTNPTYAEQARVALRRMGVVAMR